MIDILPIPGKVRRNVSGARSATEYMADALICQGWTVLLIEIGQCSVKFDSRKVEIVSVSSHPVPSKYECYRRIKLGVLLVPNRRNARKQL